MFRTALFFLIFLMSLPAFAACDPAIALDVKRPLPREAEPSGVYAQVTSGCPVTAIRVYVDHELIYEQHGQNMIDARLAMGPGSHRIVVVAWNSAGAMARDERFTVSDADGVEPLAGCEMGYVTGPVYTGEQVPFDAKSPVRMGMLANTDSAPISSMRLYIDGVDRAQTWGTSAYCLSAAMMSLKPGYHFINVQAWDSLGYIRFTGSIVQVVP